MLQPCGAEGFLMIDPAFLFGRMRLFCWFVVYQPHDVLRIAKIESRSTILTAESKLMEDVHPKSIFHQITSILVGVEL